MKFDSRIALALLTMMASIAALAAPAPRSNGLALTFTAEVQSHEARVFRIRQLSTSPNGRAVSQ